MDRWHYDTHAGLIQSIDFYGKLYRVMEARAEHARHTPASELNEFVLLQGRILLDKNGRVTRLNQEIYTPQQRTTLQTRHGNIMGFNEFLTFVDREGIDRSRLFIESSSDGGSCSSCSSGGCCDVPIDPYNLPPPPKAVCPLCEQGWDRRSIADYSSEPAEVETGLDQWVGQSFEQALKELRQNGRNRWLVVARDDEPYGLYQVSQSELSEMLLENKTAGFDGTLNVACLDDLVMPGDVLVHEGLQYKHDTCRKAAAQKAEEEEVARTLANCGFEGVTVKRTAAPEHLINHIIVQMGMKDDESEEAVAFKQRILSAPHYKISCREGEFGMLSANRLTNAVYYFDGYPIQASDFYEDAPADLKMVPVSQEDEELFLLRLWQRLVKLQRKG